MLLTNIRRIGCRVHVALSCGRDPCTCYPTFGVADAEQFVAALPAGESLRWQREASRVALIGEKLGRKKARRVLARVLE